MQRALASFAPSTAMLYRSLSMPRDKQTHLDEKHNRNNREGKTSLPNWVSYAFIHNTKPHLLTAISLAKEQTNRKPIRNQLRKGECVLFKAVQPPSTPNSVN